MRGFISWTGVSHGVPGRARRPLRAPAAPHPHGRLPARCGPGRPAGSRGHTQFPQQSVLPFKTSVLYANASPYWQALGGFGPPRSTGPPACLRSPARPRTRTATCTPTSRRRCPTTCASVQIFPKPSSILCEESRVSATRARQACRRPPPAGWPACGAASPARHSAQSRSRAVHRSKMAAGGRLRRWA